MALKSLQGCFAKLFPTSFVCNVIYRHILCNCHFQRPWVKKTFLQNDQHPNNLASVVAVVSVWNYTKLQLLLQHILSCYRWKYDILKFLWRSCSPKPGWVMPKLFARVCVERLYESSTKQGKAFFLWPCGVSIWIPLLPPILRFYHLQLQKQR